MSPIPEDEIILAIDPGNVESAYVRMRGTEILGFAKCENQIVLDLLEVGEYHHVACEMVASYGMPVGKSIFDTCVFIGEIRAHARVDEIALITRIQVKSAICHDARAKDANIRQALLDLYGPQGTKAAPGKTYGISADVWSALAIATTFRLGDFKPYELSYK